MTKLLCDHEHNIETFNLMLKFSLIPKMVAL